MSINRKAKQQGPRPLYKQKTSKFMNLENYHHALSVWKFFKDKKKFSRKIFEIEKKNTKKKKKKKAGFKCHRCPML